MPPSDPTPDAPRPRGYFNKEQLEDIDEAASVLTAARSYAGEMADQGISAEYVDSFEATISEAQGRTANVGLAKDQAMTETAESLAAAKALEAGLRKIQSSAKQKFKMLAEDGDPSTSFPLDGYLIGARINTSRAILIQSATSLIARATVDSLPGFGTPEKINAIQILLTNYKESEGEQQESSEGKGLARLSRDELVDTLNSRRSAIQHAADAIWPNTDVLTRPIRSSFQMPAARPLTL